jgi:hypothetical protein
VTLEETLHARWAASEALTALLAAERLSTGPSHAARPYAVLARGPTRTLLRTNAGDALDEVEVAFHIGHDDHDAAGAIVQQLKATFDRSAFDLGDGRRVLRMLRAGETVVPQAGGAWEFVVVFSLRVHLPNG